LSLFVFALDLEDFSNNKVIVEQMRFEAGHEVYKPLENMMFACSQRFAKDEETGAPMAEIRVSQIVPGSGFE
jgi:hypothetical protein